MKINCTVTKSFIVKNVFVLSILFTIFVSVILNKTIEFLTEIFKIMQLNIIKIITANNVQRIINFNLYRFIVIVSFTITITINDADNFA